MNKAELIQEISKDTQLSKKDIEKVLTSMQNIVTDTMMHGDKVVLKGFGSFETRVRRERMARNPRTGEEVHIDERHIPAFKPSTALKKKMKQQ